MCRRFRPSHQPRRERLKSKQQMSWNRRWLGLARLASLSDYNRFNRRRLLVSSILTWDCFNASKLGLIPKLILNYQYVLFIFDLWVLGWFESWLQTQFIQFQQFQQTENYNHHYRTEESTVELVIFAIMEMRPICRSVAWLRWHKRLNTKKFLRCSQACVAGRNWLTFMHSQFSYDATFI